ncbi:hypothetical protein JJV70_07565 [Streptomyces sp. JJ66]|nr:hypothetical protein [Streptomyces sp. JJ66]
MGAATVLYSVAITVKPAWLARPCRLRTDADGEPSRESALLIRAIGLRDTAIGAAMLMADGARARRVATGCRIAADATDALLFGTLLADRPARAKAAAFAAAWAALNALSLRSAR